MASELAPCSSGESDSFRGLICSRPSFPWARLTLSPHPGRQRSVTFFCFISLFYISSWKAGKNPRSSPTSTEWRCLCFSEDPAMVNPRASFLYLLLCQVTFGEITLCSLSYMGFPCMSTGPPRDLRLLKMPECILLGFIAGSILNIQSRYSINLFTQTFEMLMTLLT